MYCNPDGTLRGYESLEGFFLFDAAKAVGKAVVGGAKKVGSAVIPAAGGFLTAGPAGAIAAGGSALLSSGGGGQPTAPAVTSVDIAKTLLSLRAATQARQVAQAQRDSGVVPISAGTAQALTSGALVPLLLIGGVLMFTMGRK